MNDSEFLEYLQDNRKIEYYVFGLEGMWKINNTCLTLHEKQRLIEKPYCFSSKSEWYIATTRYTIVVKMSEQSLEEFWNDLDFVALEKEGDRLNERFSDSPDW